MGCEAFPQLWKGLFLKVVGEQMEQRVANEGQIGEQLGMAGSGTIFSHQGIASPVVADFDSAPVSANQSEPLLGLIVLWQRAGKLVA
jgi:hypothetical protein